MSDRFKSNKVAWGEAFDKRYEGWESDVSALFEYLTDLPPLKHQKTEITYCNHSGNSTLLAEQCSHNK